ncbi:shikimate dehydrogenase [Arcanobacterium wilhelmae]|uniref:Shikimate dehydrogenase (NADP(+)) n=1 Tax=Arcanobacterium wilhelmae TaxID=1803177 RepID=A0ABT9N9Q5_9ACTO|nr:shikimate dehydrogenase [Arcanobacterium wilhelmae]MDP9800439.1 shikimate dehydrogenase [Arcanobacterium wilhelmae]WFN89859.1 shikimate dehydrogenase [Arcanobacterium wilhelmae]
MTQLLALLAHPAGHSLSPRMHNLAAQLTGADVHYMAFDVTDLAATTTGLVAMGARGWNLSMPHKQRGLELADVASRAAELIGAANTIVNLGGRLTAHNTDGVGAMRALAANGCEISGRSIAVIGAGGAAAAIGVQAALDGARHVHIINRSAKSAIHLARKIEEAGARTSVHPLSSNWHREIGGAVALVNATSVGMAPHPRATPVDRVGELPAGIFVMDTIYAPAETRLVLEARAAGYRAENGLRMLVEQGAEAFRLFTGEDMPVDVVLANLRKVQEKEIRRAEKRDSNEAK